MDFELKAILGTRGVDQGLEIPDLSTLTVNEIAQ
jgi:hypothetical protein